MGIGLDVGMELDLDLEMDWGQGKGGLGLGRELGSVVGCELCFSPSLLSSFSRFLFLSELHEFLVHPGAPGHLDLGHGNDSTSPGLFPWLPAKYLTTLLSSPPSPLRVLPFSVPSESPHSD